LARQFKPFVYLNWQADRLAPAAQKKSPAFRRDLPLLSLQSELAILIGPLARIGLLALTAGILLLLAGLLPAALLLAGFLTRVLVLLTGFLILSAHSGNSLVFLTRDDGPEPPWLRGNASS